MAYSKETSFEIREKVKQIGIYETSLLFDISEESVKRAVRIANKYTNDSTKSTVLCIGDLHCPFELNGYFDFVCSVYREYDVTDVIFIGDIVDHHYASYHETDPDGMGGKYELEQAREHLVKWHKKFPGATVIWGNHDNIISRKAFSSNIPSEWIRSYQDVLNVPSWTFKNRTVIDDVQYMHGMGGTARTKCKADMMSTVQGHLHTQAYTEWVVGRKFKIFGMQVGCGIDHDVYSMAYASAGKKPAIGCGVIINGNVALNRMMEL